MQHRIITTGQSTKQKQRHTMHSLCEDRRLLYRAGLGRKDAIFGCRVGLVAWCCTLTCKGLKNIIEQWSDKFRTGTVVAAPDTVKDAFSADCHS